MERTNIYLPLPMLKRLRTVAAKRGVSVAELVRNAIEHFLSEYRKGQQ